jgi:putative phosphoesterase
VVIGVLSDTHGNVEAARRAVEVFAGCDVGAILHCGDVGDPEVLRVLRAAVERVWFVWGNMDRPNRAWAEAVEALGLHWPDGPLVVELGGRRILLAHGHEWQLKTLASDDAFDYVLTGHSHRRNDERIGGTRFVNPGALHRARPKTVATIDLAADAVEFHEVSRV